MLWFCLENRLFFSLFGAQNRDFALLVSAFALFLLRWRKIPAALYRWLPFAFAGFPALLVFAYKTAPAPLNRRVCPKNSQLKALKNLKNQKISQMGRGGVAKSAKNRQTGAVGCLGLGGWFSSLLVASVALVLAFVPLSIYSVLLFFCGVFLGVVF